MRMATIGVLLSVSAWAGHARADFIVSGPPSDPAYAAQSANMDDRGAQQAGSANSRSKRQPERVVFAIAQGFGDQVPLRFAVQQIVPRTVRVTYGPGADPDATVTWKGGRGWNWVLLHAVQPLGLRLVMTPMAVELRE